MTVLVAGVVTAAANLAPASPPALPEPPVPAAAALPGARPASAPAPGVRTPTVPVAEAPAPAQPAPEAAVAEAAPSFQEQEEARALAVRDAVQAEVAAQYQQIHATVLAKCFPAGAAGKGTSITYHVVVDANGQEIARGVSEARDGTSPEIRQCLRALPPPQAKVAPPGRSVSVDVAVRYP